MIKWLGLILFLVPMLAFGDARFVEAPAECHFPYDNANVNNEWKLQSCVGMLKSRNGGAVYDAAVVVRKDNLPASLFIIDGEDVRDAEAYPSGELVIKTSAQGSGTNCNIVSDGVNYVAPYWDSTARIFRAQNQYQVNVQYELSCSGGREQVQ